MDSLNSENSLLKSLVKTLQNENQSRSKERSTLIQQIDRLDHENEQLTKKCEDSRRFERQTEKMKRIILDLEIKVSQLENVLQEKTHSFSSNEELHKKLHKHQQIIHQLKSQHFHERQEFSQKLLIQNKIIEENEKQLKRKNVEIQSIQKVMQQLELENKQNKKKIENMNKCNVEMKQNVEQKDLQNIAELKDQLSHQTANNRKLHSQYEQKIQDQKLIKLLLEQKQQEIRYLNQGQKHFQKLLQLKQEEYQSEKSKLQHYIQAFALQKEELLTKIETLEHEKKMHETTKNYQDAQLSKFKNENIKLNETIIKLKNDSKMKKSIHLIEDDKKSKKSKDADSDLKDMIKDLRNQLMDVKFSNKKIGDENEKMKQVIHHHVINKEERFKKSSPRSQAMNPNQEKSQRKQRYSSRYISNQNPNDKKQESYLIKGSVSPQYDRKISSNANREKWENLQKKISILRQENDELKKAIFE